MKRIGLLLFVVGALLFAGCVAREKVSPAASEGSAAKTAENRAGSSRDQTAAGEAYPEEGADSTEKSEGSSRDGVVLKTETPVADPEAEQILKDLENEINGFLQVIESCESVEDEDLEPGVMQ
ncbi:MAG: hypothetical protein AB1556_13650 [Bacillota bacterium]